jgi:steroid 5-alpha reductase family enzyme
MWWGIFITVAAVTGNILLIVSPLLINWLLRYVSGVPMLEAKYKDREDFKEYARKTSVFIPLPPKS